MKSENFIIYFLLRCWQFHWKQLFCGSNHNVKTVLKLHFCIFLFSSSEYSPPSSLKAPFKKAGIKMFTLLFFIFEIYFKFIVVLVYYAVQDSF